MKKIGLVAVLVVSVPLLVVSCIAWRYGANAVATAEKELSPDALLRKYEWFKDVTAQLEAKDATIRVHQSKIDGLTKDLSDTPRKDWARDDRENLNQWRQEVAGLKGSFNILAADYNSQMAKVNWRFCNVGELPAGADTPLPREFKNYATN